MVRTWGVMLFVVSLAGCAASDVPAWWHALAGQSDVATYHFGWKMQGDQSLAPLQIFDDGRRTWLHYPPDQVIPAVFEQELTGDRLLHPTREGEFLVLSGVPRRLALRGGHLQAEAWRVEPDSENPEGTSAATAPAVATVIAAGNDGSPAAIRPASRSPSGAPAVASPVSGPAVRPVPASAPGAVPDPGIVPGPVTGAVTNNSVPGTRLSAHSGTAARPGLSVANPGSSLPVPPPPPTVRTASAPTEKSTAVLAAPLQTLAEVPAVHTAKSAPVAFEVSPADGNIRQALGRWARRSGWMFGAEHWAVDVDIPLAGSAAFGDTFVSAVRGLLAATELGDRPLQPCFYANRVLRVVPLAQRCDRTQAQGAAS